MKLTALIENKAPSELIGEHGLAVHIEFNGKNYLLDTGASDRFVSNADKLGVDLSKIDSAILSHSHYDHSGGYPGFFSRNKDVKVYLRKEAKEKCYVKIGPFRRYIGIPKNILEKYENHFHYVNEIFQVDHGIWLIPHEAGRDTTRGKEVNMYRKTKHGLVADDFQHEHSLVLESEDGLVILNSCCHYGVDHIVEEVKIAFPEKDVLAVVGGFHLMGFGGPTTMRGTAEEIKALGQRLLDLGVKKVFTCHCTGDKAYRILKEVIGDRLQYFSTGTVVEL